MKGRQFFSSITIQSLSVTVASVDDDVSVLPAPSKGSRESSLVIAYSTVVVNALV